MHATLIPTVSADQPNCLCGLGGAMAFDVLGMHPLGLASAPVCRANAWLRKYRMRHAPTNETPFTSVTQSFTAAAHCTRHRCSACLLVCVIVPTCICAIANYLPNGRWCLCTCLFEAASWTNTDGSLRHRYSLLVTCSLERTRT